MKNLKEISLKYDVDKLELGFLDHYEEKFEDIRNNVTKVLEIGVETGRSHRLWLEYFPNARIYGYDIFEYGYDELLIILYGGDFDIIIDDGGHTMKQQQVSLKYLFDSVKPGGYYIIEDLHTCSGQWRSLYGYEVISKGDTLTTDLLDSLENSDTSVQETNYLSREDINKIRDSIEYCNTKVGVNKYKNYNWPTLLSFMKLK